MAAAARLWAIGYDNIERAAEVRRNDPFDGTSLGFQKVIFLPGPTVGVLFAPKSRHQTTVSRAVVERPLEL
jgi:hypothetical protein